MVIEVSSKPCKPYSPFHVLNMPYQNHPNSLVHHWMEIKTNNFFFIFTYYTFTYMSLIENGESLYNKLIHVHQETLNKIHI